MVSRREHRRNTLTALGSAAVELFESRGAATTIDDIAALAGVSRRTVFRYVDSKESLVFVQPMLWFDVFDDALVAHDQAFPSGDPVERLFRGSRAIAEYIDADPEPVRRALLVAAVTPELLRGFNGVFQQWIDRVAGEVLATFDGGDTAEARFRARIIGSSVMGMVDAVTREWVFSETGTTFVGLYDDGFALLRPLFDAAAPSR